MSNYVKSTNFTAKDSLPTGDTNKVIRGTEFDTEFDAIQTAIGTKSDLAGPTFTGTATFANLTATGTVNLTGATVSNLGTITTVDINGGTIDGATIGANSASTGNFTTLSINGTAITATGAELNILDGVTASTAEINLLDGVTATTAELNILDGVTATTAELNFVDGVTSNIQTQLDAKGTVSNLSDLSITATASEINTLDGITASTAELNYVDGVTSSIQTQLDSKQAGDADLTAIGGLSKTDGNFIVGNGTTWVAESGSTARASLGLSIGTDVFAYDSNLQSFVTAFTLPTSDGTTGQAIVTDGAGTLSFTTISGGTSLPSQTGNSGYYLTTDGTTASWDNLKASPTFTGIVTINSTDALTLPVGTTAERPTAAQGMLRYNTTTSGFEGYNGSSWGEIGGAAGEFAYTRTTATATASQTTFSATYTAGYVDVYLNGIKLVVGTDFTATNGTSIVLTTGATVGDNVEILAYETFAVANALTATNNLSDLSSAATALTNLGITSTAAELNILDGVTATTAELNFLDGVTSNIQTQLDAKGTGTVSSLSDLSITSTAAELNLLDGSTADTVVNSKAVIYGSAGEITANELDVDNIQINANAVKSTNTNGNIELFPNGTGTTVLYGNTNPGTIVFNCESNSHGVTLKGPAHSAASTYTVALPDTLGTTQASGVVTSDSSSKVKFIGTTSVAEMIEKVDIPTSTSGTINFDFLSQAVQLYNTNQTANRTINFRGDGSNTLNSIMAVGESMTAAVLMKQGSTAYYLNTYQIDGSSVTPEWQGGSAPSSGNSNSIDAYVFTIIKTAASTYTVLASQGQYA